MIPSHVAETDWLRTIQSNPRDAVDQSEDLASERVDASRVIGDLERIRHQLPPLGTAIHADRTCEMGGEFSKFPVSADQANGPTTRF